MFRSFLKEEDRTVPVNRSPICIVNIGYNEKNDKTRLGKTKNRRYTYVCVLWCVCVRACLGIQRVLVTA